MKYVYVGDKDIIDYYGLAFIRNEPVEVSDSFILGKIANNGDFKQFVISGDSEVLLAAKPKKGRK